MASSRSNSANRSWDSVPASSSNGVLAPLSEMLRTWKNSLGKSSADLTDQASPLPGMASRTVPPSASTCSAAVRFDSDQPIAHSGLIAALVLAFSMPLPVVNRHQGAILEAQHRLAKAGEERRAAVVRVHTALAAAYATLTAAFAEATALREESIPGARRVFEATSEGYRQGKFSLLDVLDAQRTLFEARGQYIEALATYHKAVADAERLIGGELVAVTDVAVPQQQGAQR